MSFTKEFKRHASSVLEAAGFHHVAGPTIRFERQFSGHSNIVDTDISKRLGEARLYLAIDCKPFTLHQTGVLAEATRSAKSAEERAAAAEAMALLLSGGAMQFFDNPYGRTRDAWWNSHGLLIQDSNEVVCSLRRVDGWHKIKATLRLMQNSVQLGITVLTTIDTLADGGIVQTKPLSRFDAFDLRKAIADAGVAIDIPIWK